MNRPFHDARQMPASVCSVHLHLETKLGDTRHQRQVGGRIQLTLWSFTPFTASDLWIRRNERVPHCPRGRSVAAGDRPDPRDDACSADANVRPPDGAYRPPGMPGHDRPPPPMPHHP
jgi:hypothetical protein